MLVLTVVVLFAVDYLRRRWPSGYLWVVIPGALLLSVAVIVFWPQWWWTRVFVAGLVIIFGIVVGATIVHLSFLGAYWLVLPSYRKIISAGDTSEAELFEVFPDEEIYEVFTSRENRQPPKSRSKVILFWIRMTAPGLSDPGGLIQRLVAELFSTDEPRFYKSFLSFASRIDGPEVKLTLTLHKVFGDLPSEPVDVAELAWPTAQGAEWSVSGWLKADPYP